MTYLLGDSFLMQPLADAFAVRTGWTCTRDSVGGSGYISAGMGTNFPARLAALIATAPDVLVCGCALRSLGSPCVAQRVWPMPR